MREMLKVISAATELTGDVDKAIYWYRNEPIPDYGHRTAAKLFADGQVELVAGESAVAGLAGFLVAAARPEWRTALGIDEKSIVVFFGSEGDTDPELYKEIVGKSGAEVRAAQ